MPHESRVSGNCPERSNEELERSGVGCAAGQAQDSFVYSFKIDRPGHFIAYRGGVNVGGVLFKSGGWVAYERRDGRPLWTPHGRIKAHAAAQDLWGAFAGEQMKFFPENRPPDPPAENGAFLRREITTDNEVRT